MQSGTIEINRAEGIELSRENLPIGQIDASREMPPIRETRFSRENVAIGKMQDQSGFGGSRGSESSRDCASIGDEHFEVGIEAFTQPTLTQIGPRLGPMKAPVGITRFPSKSRLGFNPDRSSHRAFLKVKADRGIGWNRARSDRSGQILI